MRSFAWLLASGVVLLGCAPAEPLPTCTTSAMCPRDQMCVDSSCVPRQDSGICAAGAECRSDGECRGFSPPCVEALCISCGCFVRTNDGACGVGERCDMTLGCVTGDFDGGSIDVPSSDAPAPMDAPADAALLDAPVDAPTDAAGRDAPLGTVGDPCTTAADCASPTRGVAPVCLTSIGAVSFPGGYCSADCSSLVSTCGVTASCGGVGLPNQCFRRCGGGGATCRSGYECRGTFVSRVCVPPTL